MGLKLVKTEYEINKIHDIFIKSITKYLTKNLMVYLNLEKYSINSYDFNQEVTISLKNPKKYSIWFTQIHIPDDNYYFIIGYGNDEKLLYLNNIDFYYGEYPTISPHLILKLNTKNSDESTIVFSRDDENKHFLMINVNIDNLSEIEYKYLRKMFRLTKITKKSHIKYNINLGEISTFELIKNIKKFMNIVNYDCNPDEINLKINSLNVDDDFKSKYEDVKKDTNNNIILNNFVSHNSNINSKNKNNLKDDKQDSKNVLINNNENKIVALKNQNSVPVNIVKEDCFIINHFPETDTFEVIDKYKHNEIIGYFENEQEVKKACSLYLQNNKEDSLSFKNNELNKEGKSFMDDKDSSIKQPNNYNKVQTKNSFNKIPKRKSNGQYSLYKGISFNKVVRKWTAGIRLNGDYKSLGLFDSEEEAYQYRKDYILSHSLPADLKNEFKSDIDKFNNVEQNVLPSFNNKKEEIKLYKKFFIWHKENIVETLIKGIVENKDIFETIFGIIDFAVEINKINTNRLNNQYSEIFIDMDIEYSSLQKIFAELKHYGWDNEQI